VNETQKGYLLLADISGYTSYVASTELTHSQEILSELLEVIVSHFKRQLVIHKLEGDAVFAYTPISNIQRGESLLELIESTYLAFRSRRDAARRRTTCTCNACRNISNLDLKFLVHYGEFFVQDVMGAKELVGSDVNLIHRLLKNHVSESTGWKAYILFTEQSLQALDIHLESLAQQAESYEHLGDVCTFSMDFTCPIQRDHGCAARRCFCARGASHL
jgi:class 3 adenylate cyclase